MSQKMKSISLASIMVLSVMSSLLVASVAVSASTVVITEAVQIVDGGTASDAQAAVGSDRAQPLVKRGPRQLRVGVLGGLWRLVLMLMLLSSL